MYISVIIVVLVCSVIYLKCAGCAVVQSCYKFDKSLWEFLSLNSTLTNIWCKNQCKGDANNRYFGTSYTICYCRKTEITGSDEKEKDECKSKCPGNKDEFCGSILGWENGKPSGSFITPTHVTVSEINRPPNTLTAKVTQTTSITPMAVRETFTTNFMRMISTDTSPATVTNSTPLNTRKSITSTSEKTQTSKSTESTETVTHASTVDLLNTRYRLPVPLHAPDEVLKAMVGIRKTLLFKQIKYIKTSIIPLFAGLSTETETVTNTQATSTTSASIRESTSDFMNMITNNTSPETVTHSLPSTTPELFSTTSDYQMKNGVRGNSVRLFVFVMIQPKVYRGDGENVMVQNASCTEIEERSCSKAGTMQRKRNRIRAISNIQDQRDSSKPLQENFNTTEKYYASRCGNDFHPDEMKRETYQRRREDQHSRMEWMQYI
ncbi:unnamed protein product [Mytilus coruscus]|uniref:WSC domain-containing protein n=1 Tax=Mytilus coruscus TaxID=42192 RepID=A0A6J8A0H5_MYTCO|nr:unnamed protein product [Mytilus coruscus]